MKKILVILALIIFVASVIIAFRYPMSLIPLAGIFIITLKYSDRLGRVLASLIIIFGSLAVLLYVNSMIPLWGDRYDSYLKMESVNQRSRERNALEFNNVIEAENTLKKQLKDSDSASFTGEYVSQAGAVCGYVNAKNSFGAYSGIKRFTYITGLAFIDDGSAEFSSSWNKICAK